ncbi:MAG: EAL domain-containing protein [Lachnospiraceae bacterium]|nr:EAL domain-containing protein [Lachnospiraceae bacterium]
MYNFNIEFHIIGLALMAMLMTMSNMKGSLKNASNRSFSVLFFRALFSILANIATNITVNFAAFLPRELVYFTAKIYLLTLILVASSMFRYTYVQAHPEGINNERYGYLQEIITVLLGIGVFLLPVYCLFDEKSVYILGEATNLCSVGCITYLLGAVILIIVRWNKINKRRRRAILFAIFGTFIVGIAQSINRGLELTSLYLGMSMVYIFFSLENPLDYIDRRIKIYNRMAMDIYLEESFREKKKISLITLHFFNMRYLRTFFGGEHFDDLQRAIIGYLEHYPTAKVFASDDHETTIVFEGQEDFEEARKEIAARFEKEWEIGEYSVNVSVSMVIFPSTNIPEKFEDAEQSFVYFRDEMLKLPESTVYYVGFREIEEKKKYERLKDIFEDALNNDGITSYYHIIYDRKTGIPEAAEALMRIRYDDGKFIENSDAVSAAERDGFIMRIIERHFENVCRMINEVQPEKYGIRKIAINLSAYQCMQKNLVDSISVIMREYSISPTLLCFEIANDAIQIGGAAVRMNIARLTAAGCETFLDGFGQDNLDMRAFVDLPITGVKLDAGIVTTCLSNNYMKSAIELICHVAKELRKKVVIYGIETENDLREMDDIDCRFLQGNYFSRAMSQEEFKNTIMNVNKGENIELRR